MTTPLQQAQANAAAVSAYLATLTPTPPPVLVTIAFNSEGGTVVNSITVPVGTSIELPSTTYAGHTFTGWFTATTGGTAIVFPYVAPASLTLYAQWVAVTPPPASDPSGLAIPAVRSGFTRAVLDDFTAKGLGPDWCPPYNGTPGGTHGKFLATHTLAPGDSLLHLQMYQDVNASDTPDNNWAGAGVNTNVAKHLGFPVGSMVQAAMKWDAHPSIAGMGMFFAAVGWPPEIDFVESIATVGGNNFNATAHYGKQNSNPQELHGKIDLTQWHTFGCLWTAATIFYLADGNVWGSLPNPDTSTSDPTSLVQKQFVAFQIQDGDPSYPAPDASVTSQHPVELLIDWVVIDVPA